MTMKRHEMRKGDFGDSLCETVNQSTSHLFSTNDHTMQCTERLAYPAVEQGSQELSAQQKMARHSCAGVQPGRATCDVWFSLFMFSRPQVPCLHPCLFMKSLTLDQQVLGPKINSTRTSLDLVINALRLRVLRSHVSMNATT